MKKILFLAGEYYPYPFANGVCIKNVINELKRKNYEVDVVCFNTTNNKELHLDTYNGSKIYYVNNFKNKGILEDFRQRIKNILLAPMFPATDVKLINKYYGVVKKALCANKYDMIIAVYNPIEALIVGKLVVKKVQCKYCLYMLDTLTNTGQITIRGLKTNKLVKKYTDRKNLSCELKLFECADLIILMNSHLQHYKQKIYDKFRSKIVFSDLPLFDPTNFCMRPTKRDTKINMVYCGVLSEEYRNPRYLCEAVIKCKEYIACSLDVYCRGNCGKMLEQYSEKSNSVIQKHEYVEYSKMKDILNNSDVLISIGNYNSDMVPSKIFEYMSTGKKIIHFIRSKNDSCLSYLYKYPASLIINEEVTLEKNIQNILDFLNKPLNKNDNTIGLKDLFKFNMPEYTVKIIDDVLNNLR